MFDIRDLQGEELAGLVAASPSTGIRFLVQALDVIAAADDGDVLAVGEGRALHAAAAGYSAPFGDATLVVLREEMDARLLRCLIVHLEASSLRRHCLALAADVDAADTGARRTLESLGFNVTGAGVAAWTDHTGSGAPPLYTDVWRLRKDLGPGARPEVEVPVPPGAEAPPAAEQDPEVDIA